MVLLCSGEYMFNQAEDGQVWLASVDMEMVDPSQYLTELNLVGIWSIWTWSIDLGFRFSWYLADLAVVGLKL